MRGSETDPFTTDDFPLTIPGGVSSLWALIPGTDFVGPIVEHREERRFTHLDHTGLHGDWESEWDSWDRETWDRHWDGYPRGYRKPWPGGLA